jgi:hypothetical protein
MLSAVILGLALAVACALATSVSFLLKQRGAVSAPPVRGRHPVRSAAGLFHSRWFAVGWLVALGAWGLHVGALALAPLSVVQAVLSAGLVFLAVLAERFFGFRLVGGSGPGWSSRRRGLRDHQDYPRGATQPASGLRTGGIDQHRVRRAPGRHGVADGWPHPRSPGEGGPAARCSRGALFGISDGAQVPHPCRSRRVLELISPWAVAGAGRLGDRLLRLGPWPADRPEGRGHRLTSVAARPCRDRRRRPSSDSIGHGAVPIAGRMIAFGLVIAGAALIPAPLRVSDGGTGRAWLGRD